MPARDAIIRELMSMLDVKYQVAKKVVKLSKEPLGTTRVVGKSSGRRWVMTQATAASLVGAATRTIELVDEGG